MSTYKLYYFNGRGRAELARLIFAQSGQAYEDIRIEGAQWPTRQSEMPLAGRDNFEQAQVDAVVDTICGCMEKFVPLLFQQDEAKKQEALKKFFDEDLPEYFKSFETLGKLYGNGGPFFVGNQLTWADLFFYEVSLNLLRLNSNCLDKYSWLQQNRAEVEKQPKIAAYIKNRPQTSF